MVKDVYHYFIFTSMGILVASIIKNTEKSSHIAKFAASTLILEILTILSIKTYAIPGIFTNLLAPVSIFVFLYLL